MTDTLFEIKGADVFIPGSLERSLVLKNIDWSLAKGEHCAILGANGAGKSSLLKLLHGDLWACSGFICWYAANGQRETSRIAARKLTAIVSPDLQESLQRSPWPLNLRDFLNNSNDSSGWAKFAIEKTNTDLECLLESCELKARLDTSLNRLSQGQLRLALLLRALLKTPRILLLDEYTDGLDAKNRHFALELLKSIRDETTIIFTSHRPETLPSWCQGRLYLHKGRRMDYYQSSVIDDEPAEIQERSSSQTLFALSNVTVYIDRKKILEKINWQSRRGEHWLIDGDNGSGKSTFLRLLVGDEFAASDGEIKRWNPASRRWITTLAEARSMFILVSDLSQIQNDYPLCSLELLCTAFDNSVGLHREIRADEKERAFVMLGKFFPEVNLSIFAHEDIRRLSTGQLRRLYLARAMLAEPAALLLDEPLNGLDASSRGQYMAALHGLASKGASAPAIIMVTHYEDEAPSFIRRRARLEEGRLKIII